MQGMDFLSWSFSAVVWIKIEIEYHQKSELSPCDSFQRLSHSLVEAFVQAVACIAPLALLTF